MLYETLYPDSNYPAGYVITRGPGELIPDDSEDEDMCNCIFRMKPTEPMAQATTVTDQSEKA